MNINIKMNIKMKMKKKRKMKILFFRRRCTGRFILLPFGLQILKTACCRLTSE